MEDGGRPDGPPWLRLDVVDDKDVGVGTVVGVELVGVLAPLLLLICCGACPGVDD